MSTTIVVVGLGSIGRRHARLLADRSDLEVVGCETDEAVRQRARAEIPGLSILSSFQDAVSARPAAFVIATPHHLHADQTITALEAGIPVLCEKPMAESLASARRMADAAERTGSLLSIAFMLHFNPIITRLRKLIDIGAIGTVVQIRYLVGSYITLLNSGSRYQASLEGALLMDYAHQPDLITWLTGRRPLGVYVAGVRGGALEHSSTPNALSMVLDYDAPLLATVDLNYLQLPQHHEGEIIGDAGSARFDLDTGVIELRRVEANDVIAEDIATERDDAYRAEHDTFLGAVAGSNPPSSPPHEAIVATEIIEAGLCSLRDKRRVALAEIENGSTRP